MVGVGAVHLTVADLGRSVDHYERVVGLCELSRDGGRAVLGAGSRELLVLVEQPGARRALGRTGLYHFALLVPERADLARWLAHAARSGARLAGLSDHAVSEAIYLTDPDGHGIEIYHDRPRSGWEGRVAELMTTVPLDVRDLLDSVPEGLDAPFAGLPDGTIMGHVHLKVAAIAPSIAFYRDLLGLGLMADLGASAAFFGAHGYHHHVGANTWESAGAPPPEPDMAALRRATLLYEDAAARDATAARLADAGLAVEDGALVRDPSGNALLLAVAA